MIGVQYIPALGGYVATQPSKVLRYLGDDNQWHTVVPKVFKTVADAAKAPITNGPGQPPSP